MATRKIKKSITEKEHQILINYTKGDDSIKAFTQKRFLRIFTLLFYSGMRINELSQITCEQMKQIVKNGETVIVSHKNNNERILYFSEQGIKEVKKYFDLSCEGSLYVINSWNNPKNRMHEISLINLVNRYMKKILGDGFTSHSFRQGLLTQMGARSINPKIIQSFIGHADVKTTLRYIRPTADDVKQSLIR